MLRKNISLALDPEMRAEPGLSHANVAIVSLICLSIIIGVLETEDVVANQFGAIFSTAHVFFFLIFSVEYAARIYGAPINPRYPSSFRYALTFPSILDLVVLLSFLLPIFGLETALLRMFRAARLFRLARIGRYSLAVQLIMNAISERRYELGISVVIALSLMLLSACALYIAERHVQPDEFGSIPRAIWWSVATLTTVGYGDIVPVTVMGRIAAGFTALTGIGIIALPTGILAGAFGDALRNIRAKRD